MSVHTSTNERTFWRASPCQPAATRLRKRIPLLFSSAALSSTTSSGLSTTDGPSHRGGPSHEPISSVSSRPSRSDPAIPYHLALLLTLAGSSVRLPSASRLSRTRINSAASPGRVLISTSLGAS